MSYSSNNLNWLLDRCKARLLHIIEILWCEVVSKANFLKIDEELVYSEAIESHRFCQTCCLGVH